MTAESVQVTLLIVGSLVLLTAAQIAWVRHRYDSHRVRRFFGLGAPGEIGRFHWREGVWEGEVRSALSPDFARRFGWLMSHRTQRLLVAFNVASWALFVFGAADVPWNLGFAESHFSWWGVPVVLSYLLVRQSVRVVADAPDELIDERLRTLRDRAHAASYRIVGWILPIGLGVVLGVADDQALTTNIDDVVFVFFVPFFVYAALPSMVLAWRGDVAAPAVNEPARPPA